MIKTTCFCIFIFNPYIKLVTQYIWMVYNDNGINKEGPQGPLKLSSLKSLKIQNPLAPIQDISLLQPL